MHANFIIEERDGTGTLLAAYVYGNKILSQTRGTQVRYYHGDSLGSIRFLTDSAGAVTDKYSYDAFGNLTSKEGTTNNDFLFAGEQYDTVTSLYYLRARYMNPQTGRFITRDKYAGKLTSPITQHRYLYANPVKYTDPTGRFSLSECMASIYR